MIWNVESRGDVFCFSVSEIQLDFDTPLADDIAVKRQAVAAIADGREGGSWKLGRKAGPERRKAHLCTATAFIR